MKHMLDPVRIFIVQCLRKTSWQKLSKVPNHVPLLSTDVNRTICALLSFCSPTPVWGEGWSTQGDWPSISKLDQCRTQFDPAAKCCRYKKQTVHKLYSIYDVTNVLFHPTLPAISWKTVFAVLYVSMLYRINQETSNKYLHKNRIQSRR